MNHLSRALLCLGFLLVFQFTHAATDPALSELEQRLTQFTEQQKQNAAETSAPPLVLAEQLSNILGSVEQTSEESGSSISSCHKTTSIPFAGRYVLKVSAQDSKPCAIYDLSFPTVESLFTFSATTKISGHEFSADDYLAWLKGNFTTVQHRIQSMANQAPVHTWVRKIKFRKEYQASSRGTKNSSLYPMPVFKASDLEVGSKFQFSAAERKIFKDLIANMGSAELGSDQKFWTQAVDDPVTLLDRVRFVWNDAEKFYEVVLDGSFLPLFAPVALVHYEKPYQFAMQRYARLILSTAIEKLAAFIPEPIVQRLVSVALSEVFGSVENMYNYQLNLMEPALRTGLAQATNLAVAQIYERALDITFAGRSGFFIDYIQALFRGEKFDWLKVEKLGRQARYRAEKSRDISMNKLNSKLVLKYKCQTEVYHNYFAKCIKGGKLEGVYSLIGESSLLFWNLGPDQAYSARLASEILLKRSSTRLLAATLKVARLPILDFLTNTLAGQLDKFAQSGQEDEAFLRGSLMLEKQSTGSLDPLSQDVYKWLYLQHLNPFLPFSEKSELSIIQKNIAKQLSQSQELNHE